MINSTLSMCPQCNKVIDSNSRFCKHCAFNLGDANLGAQSSRSTSSVSFVKKRVLILLIVGVIVAFSIYLGERIYSRLLRPTEVMEISVGPESIPKNSLKQSGITVKVDPAPSSRTASNNITSQPQSSASSGYSLSQDEMLRVMQDRGVWNMFSGTDKYQGYEILQVGEFNNEAKYWPARVRIHKRSGGSVLIEVNTIHFLKNDFGEWWAKCTNC